MRCNELNTPFVLKSLIFHSFSLLDDTHSADFHIHVTLAVGGTLNTNTHSIFYYYIYM